MKQFLLKVSSIFRPWFYVDTRALGLYRMFLGMLCLIDISRRFDIIDAFYTNSGIISYSSSNSFYKTFSLLSTFTKSWEVHLFFVVGIIFSIFLIIGFKTKLSQIICTIIIISIHNRVIMLENAGDFVFNSILILSLFMPLGLTFSIDSFKKSLKNFKETNTKDLNNRKIVHNQSYEIFSLAFFAMLLQLSSIYFFTGLNKSGFDWTNGTAVYKMYQLDTFLTPIGYFIRDSISLPISKILTYSTITLEYAAPFLLLFPLWSHILRRVGIIFFTIFHLSIRMSIKVGMFSFTMISIFVLLLDEKIINYIKEFLKKRVHSSKYILFYDSDCGFCHYTARMIRRVDLFEQIKFADKNYEGKFPENYSELSNKTAILVNENNNKQWIKHKAFGKVLMIIPFGFTVSWLFFIPLLSNILSKCYDYISLNRTSISTFLGLPACSLKADKNNIFILNDNLESQFNKVTKYIFTLCTSACVLVLICANMNYNVVANEAVNKNMTKYGFKKFQYNKFLKKISYYPRMIQRWNMFSPTVLNTDKTVIIEATLSDGRVVDLFTGENPILNSLDYKVLWHDGNQFWRKFFSRVTKKQNSKYITSFESWVKKYNNHYFDELLGDNRIKSVKIWSLSQRNPDMNSDKVYKVNKRLLNSKSSSKGESQSQKKQILKKNKK